MNSKQGTMSLTPRNGTRPSPPLQIGPAPSGHQKKTTIPVFIPSPFPPSKVPAIQSPPVRCGRKGGSAPYPRVLATSISPICRICPPPSRDVERKRFSLISVPELVDRSTGGACGCTPKFLKRYRLATAPVPVHLPLSFSPTMGDVRWDLSSLSPSFLKFPEQKVLRVTCGESK